MPRMGLARLELAESPVRHILLRKGASMRRFPMPRGSDQTAVFDELGVRMGCRHIKFTDLNLTCVYIFNTALFGKAVWRNHQHTWPWDAIPWCPGNIIEHHPI